MEQVPRHTSPAPFAFPCFVLCLIGVEIEGLVDYQGRAGIIAIVRWNLRLLMLGVQSYTDLPCRLGYSRKGFYLADTEPSVLEGIGSRRGLHMLLS